MLKLLAFAAFSAGALAQELLVNPGFEADPAGVLQPTGWTSSNPIANFVDNSAPRTGNNDFVFLSPPSDPGTLTQNVAAVIPGQCYELAFWARSGTVGTPAEIGLSVSFGTLNVATDLALQPAGPYVGYQFFALATTDPALTFTGYNLDLSTELDDVSLVLADPLACLTASTRARGRRARRQSHKAQW